MRHHASPPPAGPASAASCLLWVDKRPQTTFRLKTSINSRCWRPQVGNQAFAFAFQQLLDLSYLWSTSTHLNVTNATLASGAVPADEVRVLNDTRTVVSGTPSVQSLAAAAVSFPHIGAEFCPVGVQSGMVHSK